MLNTRFEDIKNGCILVLLILLIGFTKPSWASQDQINLAQSISHYTMGVVNDLNGLTEEALSEYQKAAQLDSQNYVIQLHLGMDYARVGKLTEAINVLKLASNLNPQDVQSRYLLALVYSSQKDFDKAAAEYELILKHFSEAQPDNVEIYTYLGQLYYSQGKFNKAIEQYKKVFAMQPQNADVIYLLGSLYLELGDRSQAASYFKKAIEVDPMHEGSLNSLAYMYAEDGEHLDEALSLIKRALEISPDNGAYLDSMGWVYYKKAMYSQALETLLKADSVMKDPVIYDHLGDVYFKMHEVEKAKKYWKLALDLSPGQSQIIKKLDDLDHPEKSPKEILSSHNIR